jgi:SAM-dependent methyltransferase
MTKRRCVTCGHDRWIALPEIGPFSMASDLRIVPLPLRREACQRCGLPRAARELPSSSFRFDHGYALYAHAPNTGREGERQRSYAEWIASAMNRQPRSVLDVGCGNGSLLLALARQCPAAVLTGCDPSRESVDFGRAAGLTLWEGTAADLPAGMHADLVVTANVIEHLLEPVEFLSALRSRLAEGGTAVIICPDGARPDVELLIADHVHSFDRIHLDAILELAGLRPVTWSRAPASLGAFQLMTAMAADAVPEAPALPMDAELLASRIRYLQHWQALDGGLLARVGTEGIACFGAGETAGLLRAYAPRTWSRVQACTVDAAGEGDRFGEIPVIPLHAVAADATILVATHPRDQRTVAERLRRRFPSVVTWDDLIAA